MALTTKEEIQALDSLGRWEPARVIAINDDGTFEVSFIGWGKEFNTRLARDCVRPAVHPFYQEIDTIQSRSRKTTRNEKSYLSYLRSLESGVIIQVETDDGVVPAEVRVVDRFNRSVTAKMEGINRVVHASKIKVPLPQALEKSHTVPKKKKRRMNNTPASTTVAESINVEKSCTLPNKKRRMNNTPASTTVAESINGSSVPSDSQRPSGQNHSPAACHPIENAKDMSGFSSLMSKTGEIVSVGDPAKVTLDGHPISLGVLQLMADDMFDEGQSTMVAEGFVFGDHDIRVQVPLERLGKAKDTSPTFREKKILKNAYKEAECFSLERSKLDYRYRLQVRRTQIAGYLKNEVRLALTSRCNSRSVSLGVCALDTDPKIIGMDPLKRDKCEFSYRMCNIEQLDKLLGLKWDIELGETRTSFVTAVHFKINSRNVVVARILTAFSWVDLRESTDYRRDIRESLSM